MPFTETPSIYKDYEYIYENVQNDMLFGNQNNLDLFNIKEIEQKKGESDH